MRNNSGYGKVFDVTVLGQTFQYNSSWETYRKKGDGNISSKEDEVHFFSKGCCPYCGQGLNEIVEDNQPAFNKVIIIDENNQLKTSWRKKDRHYSCGKCGSCNSSQQRARVIGLCGVFARKDSKEDDRY